MATCCRMYMCMGKRLKFHFSEDYCDQIGHIDYLLLITLHILNFKMQYVERNSGHATETRSFRLFCHIVLSETLADCSVFVVFLSSLGAGRLDPDQILENSGISYFQERVCEAGRALA